METYQNFNFLNSYLHAHQQLHVGVVLVLESEPAVADVVEVFQPLEVGNRHPARVQVQIGHDQRPVLLQNGVRPRRRRPVSALADYLGLDEGRVLHVDGLFGGAGEQDVALLVHQIAFVRFGAGKAEDRAAVFQLVVFELVRVDPVLVENAAVVLDDSDALCSFPVQIPQAVQTDVAVALHYERLSLVPRRQAYLVHPILFVDEVLDAEQDSPAGGRHSSVDASLGDWFSGDAGVRVDVAVTDRRLVRVGHPRHLPAAGAHVGRRHVDARPDERLLRQLHGEPPRDLLQLVLRVVSRVDAHSRLPAPVRHVDDGALPRHQRRQRLDLVEVHIGGIPDPALARRPVLAVLGAVAGYYFEVAVVPPDGKVDLQHVVARPHHLENPLHLLPAPVDVQGGLCARLGVYGPVHFLNELVLDQPRALLEVSAHHFVEARVVHMAAGLKAGRYFGCFV